jgi:hypothetical protein
VKGAVSRTVEYSYVAFDWGQRTATTNLAVLDRHDGCRIMRRCWDTGRRSSIQPTMALEDLFTGPSEHKRNAARTSTISTQASTSPRGWRATRFHCQPQLTPITRYVAYAWSVQRDD